MKDRLVAGDFTGDGQCDLATLFQYGSGKVNWFVYQSSGSAFSGSQNWREWSAGVYSADSVNGRISVGRINADAKDDIAVIYKYANKAAKILVYTPNSSGTAFDDRVFKEWPTNSYDADVVTNRFLTGHFRGYDYGEMAANYKYDTCMKIWTYYTYRDDRHATGIMAGEVNLLWWNSISA